MAIKTHVRGLEIEAPAGADPVRGRIFAVRSTDDQIVVALGLDPKMTALRIECSRANFDAFILRCVITEVDDWPVAVVPLPAPRKP